MIIGVDFDGTCVTHDFPNVGKEIGAVEILRKLVGNGHQIILFTMRSNKLVKWETNIDDTGNYVPTDRNTLQDAVDWFYSHRIPLYGINENPTQRAWTNSPKPYCHYYIDDSAIGCPLTFNDDISNRPYVDWKGVEAFLIMKEVL